MKLRVQNVMVLDLTELTPETADTIDSVDNCMLAVFSQRSSALQGRIPFSNLMKSVVAPDGVRVRFVNGKETIGPAQADAGGEPAFYLVNGKLTIESGVTPERLKRLIAGGVVNGKVLCTESQAETLRSIGLSVNGKIASYPDGVILCEGTLMVDARFVSAAKDGETYMATGQVCALGDEIAALAEKGVRLQGSRLLVRDKNLEAARQVWNGDTSAVRCVPEGFVYADDLILDRFSLRRLGPSIYVDGDCTVSDDLTPEQVSAGLSKLIVGGTLTACERLIDPLLDVCAEYGDVMVYSGRLLDNSGSMEISAATLEGLAEPVTLRNSGYLAFESDVTSDLLREKVLAIHCSGEIRVPKPLHGAALSLAKRLDGHISVADNDSDEDQKQTGVDPDIRVMENAMELKLV